MSKPLERVGLTGDITEEVKKICQAYNLGELINFAPIEVGYEDCNISFQTGKGKFLTKIFSKIRTPEMIHRYTRIMEEAAKAGVNHPKLHLSTDGNVLWSNGDLPLVVMDFVEGKTFLKLDRAPDDFERQAVVEQAAKINTISYHPPHLFDSWAIPNIDKMFNKVRTFIQPDDLSLVQHAIDQFENIDLDSLPQCFVHSDFTKANIMKGDDEKIYVLDFSVSNWYPRIQELAVIAANLMYDKYQSLSKTCEILSTEYSHIHPLTPIEKQSLYDYALAGVAMEFMGSHQEKFINGNDTQETEYWMNLGRKGLQQARGVRD